MRILPTALTLALLATASLAQAQTSTPTPAAPAAATPAPAAPAMAAKPAAKPAMSADDKKAKSKQCSTEADAKSLHGKARKKFREECKKGA